MNSQSSRAVFLTLFVLLAGVFCTVPATGAGSVKASPSSSSAVPNGINHAIHISLDGLGGVYLQRFVTEAPQDFPAFRRLMAEGAYTFNARCDYDVSVTEPNHTTILTGRPVLQQPTNVPFVAPHGFADNYDPGAPWTLHTLGNPYVPYKASVFDVVHDYGFSTAFYANKDKFDLFIRSYSEEYGAPDEIGEDNGTAKMDVAVILPTYYISVTYQNSSNLISQALDNLSNSLPTYTFIHLADEDIMGHSYGWGSPAYRQGMRNLDRQLGRVLAAIEANESLSNRTALIVTSDHGGGDSVGSHVMADELVVYTIPLFIWGPGIGAGLDAYLFFSNRAEPGTNYLDYNAQPQPLRNGDTSNIALSLLGLPPIPGSCLIPEWGPTPVRLTFRRKTEGLEVSWSTTNHLSLQAAEACAPGADWQTITNGIITDGPLNTLLLDPQSSTLRFFRLSGN